MCRIGPVAQGQATFEICVIDASGDENGTIRLTKNNVLDATPSWSPDGTQIVFHKNQPPNRPPFQLWVVKADTTCPLSGIGSCTCQDPYPGADGPCEMQLTNTPGVNVFAHWGVLRVHVPKK
jgi:WD40-like Beta Propeller Repeat